MSKLDRSCDQRSARALAQQLTNARKAFPLPRRPKPNGSGDPVDHPQPPVASFSDTFRDRVWRSFLDWAREVASGRATYLCDRDGLVIEEAGVVTETDAEQTSMMVAVLDQIERRSGGDRTPDLIGVRVGSETWTALPHRETRLVFLLAGPSRPDEPVLEVIERALAETIAAEKLTGPGGDSSSAPGETDR